MAKSSTSRIDETIKDDEMIRAGSHSRLVTFETCNFRAALAYIHKVPEPDRGPPPRNLKEWPNDRGSRIHDGAEAYVRGTGPFLSEMSTYKPEFERLKELFAAGQAQLEQMWTYDQDWTPLPDLGEFPSGPWPREFAEAFYKIWMRIKTDATVFISPTEAVVIDYKTGRRFGNEVKHAEQLQLYAVGAAVRYPELETIHTELWYLDQDEIADMTFTRKQALRYLKGFNQRNQRMTSAREFPPNPNAHSCKWCPYGPANSGHCKVGVQ